MLLRGGLVTSSWAACVMKDSSSEAASDGIDDGKSVATARTGRTRASEYETGADSDGHHESA